MSIRTYQMIQKSYIIILVTVLSLNKYSVECFTPTCEPDNPFRFFCFPIEYCSAAFQDGCRQDICGFYENEITTLVRIRDTDILPRCAFYNSNGLRYINGVNAGLKILAMKAFANLPDVIEINLSFNLIRQVNRDVFINVSATDLDLSYNKIQYLEKDAFLGMTNLKVLNISWNELRVVPANSMVPSVDKLILSHNFIDRILINSRRFRNITSIDISYNKLDRIAMSLDYPMNEIDLTSNLLYQFDYIDIWSTEEIKLAFNLFTTLPEYLVDLNAKKIQLYPNPWRCDELQKVWKLLQRNDIKLAATAIPEEFRNSAICFSLNTTAGFSPETIYQALKVEANKKRKPSCLDDRDCADQLACRGGSCIDPCRQNVFCDRTSVCETKEHRFMCSCPTGMVRNPLEMRGECQDAQCFIDEQCGAGQSCVDQVCIQCDSCGVVVSSTTAKPMVIPPRLPWWYYEIPVLKSPIPV